MSTLTDMQNAEMDLAAAGDMAGAHMLGDIIEDYCRDRCPEANALIALAGARKRLESGGSES